MVWGCMVWVTIFVFSKSLPFRTDDPAAKRRSTGGVTFGGPTSPSGHTPSPVATPPDPPKLNKMAQLKKTVTERRQQQKLVGEGQQKLVEEGVASDEPGATLTAFTSLSPQSSKVASEMGHRAMSGDLPRQETTPVDDTPKSSDIFVSKSSQPPSRPASTKQLRRQGGSDGDVSSGHVTISEEQDRHDVSDV